MQRLTRDLSYLLLFEAGIIVRNTLVTYDRENDKIGFWKTNCSELWKRLQVPVVPVPAPVVYPAGNTSEEMPPTEAPSGLPPDFHAGRVRSNHLHCLYAKVQFKLKYVAVYYWPILLYMLLVGYNLLFCLLIVFFAIFNGLTIYL